MKRMMIAAALLLLLSLAVSVSAQDTIDPQSSPNFAAITLQAGFPLDPYLVRVESSGSIAAETVQDDCVGFVPGTPDVVVNWAGETDQLSFFVYSDTDPVLLVVTPSGDILCNDDYSLDTLNPVVTVATPADGAYAVYVGAFSAEDVAYGWLGVTQQTAEGIDIATADLRPMLALRAPATEAQLVLRSPSELQAAARPIFGETRLEQGFGTQIVPATAAGVEPASLFSFNSDTPCAGYINLVPSHRFIYTGDEETLAVFFNGQADASLIVGLPDGTFVCSGDSAEGNLNPALLLESAQPGEYTVWLGSAAPSEIALGVLVISEDTAAQPDVLTAGQ
ncbi:MAG TPA: hypothetical protein VER79_13375 [Candidatus Limnocylindrales bacterium]|nr:hypothetical protein [Candidatus Limnocylindrales bacterium]